MTPSSSQQQITVVSALPSPQQTSSPVSTAVPQRTSSGVVAKIRGPPPATSAMMIPRSTMSVTSFTTQERPSTSTLPTQHRRPQPALVPMPNQAGSMTLGRSGGGRRSYCEPPRLPEYNSFTLDHRKLSSEGRQMAMLNQLGNNNPSKSATLGRVPTKISSEV